VLSALPIVNMGNACCCLWVIAGGVTAAYLLQNGQAAPITSGDGAAVGFHAGVVGAIVWQLAAIPVTILMGPVQARMLEQEVVSMGFQEKQAGFDAGAADRWKKHISPAADRWFRTWFHAQLRSYGYDG
jgi:hypothetical protein